MKINPTKNLKKLDPGKPDHSPCDKRTRRTAFYFLIGIFIVVVLASEIFAMMTSNEKLVKEILSLLEKIILLVIGYYFGKK